MQWWLQSHGIWFASPISFFSRGTLRCLYMSILRRGLPKVSWPRASWLLTIYSVYMSDRYISSNIFGQWGGFVRPCIWFDHLRPKNINYMLSLLVLPYISKHFFTFEHERQRDTMSASRQRHFNFNGAKNFIRNLSIFIIITSKYTLSLRFLHQFMQDMPTCVLIG